MMKSYPYYIMCQGFMLPFDILNFSLMLCQNLIMFGAVIYLKYYGAVIVDYLKTLIFVAPAMVQPILIMLLFMLPLDYNTWVAFCESHRSWVVYQCFSNE